MNQEDANKWKAGILNEILLALASSADLKDVLVYKGALILNIRLGTERMSLDIDSNLIDNFVVAFPKKEDQEKYLADAMSKTISRYFERQEPVRFKLETLRIIRSPRNDHPLGWDAFSIKINIADFKNIHVRGLPALSIDIAAPETLSGNSISDINLGGHQVKAYTLQRIAGEKLRAFLSTLPAYRAKVSKPGEAVRVKDLYDIARIYRVMPIENKLFWEQAGGEFKLACASRFIDCQGLDTFKQNWEYTEAEYEIDTTLPKDVPLEEVDRVIIAINAFFTTIGITPFSNPLP